MIASDFPPEAEESRHDSRPMGAHRACFSPARGWKLSVTFALSAALAACSGDVSTQPSGELGPRTLSGYVGNPSLVDATVTLRLDDGASTISARSDDQASYSLTVDKSLALPIEIQVEGGTDLLTGDANDSVLSALSFDADANSLNVSHLSSLAVRMASCAGRPDEAALDAAWTRIRARSGMTALPDTSNLTTSAQASIMRADLILEESIDRTRLALSAVTTLTASNVLDAIACDLADEDRLNGSSTDADVRVLASFRAAEAAVILEFMADSPYRAGAPAGSAINAMLRQVSGDAGADLAALPVPPAPIATAERHLTLLQTEFPDGAWIDLLLSLFSGNPEAAVTEALTASRLTRLWALPEQVALTDAGTIDRLGSAAARQTRSSPPVVAISANPASVTEGETSSLSWAASDADVCVASGAWSGNRAAQGAQTTSTLNASAEFRLTCIGLAGLAEAAAQVAVIDVAERPLISLSADSPNIVEGSATTLRWTSSNATACTASGAWSGPVPVVGARTTGTLTSTADFVLTCTGPGGSDSAALRITVSAAPDPNPDPEPDPDPDPVPDPEPEPEPTVALSANSTLIDAGGTATLSWSSSDASQCTASGGWSGDRGTTGSAQVGPITAQTTFSLSCSGAGGTSLAMVAIRVNGAMTLNWVAPTENVDGTPLTDLQSYRVYYGTSSRNYGDAVPVADPTASSVEITAPSGDYYVAMTALDAEGNESAYSNEVLKSVP
jgi:hypothetical protein